MSNKLDQHYNDFGGIDSRTNVMFQNPKFARDGKNLAFRTDAANGDFDVICKRRGNQHRSLEQYGAEVGLLEYKFKDLNTGAAKSEILGVAADGKLRKRYSHKLKITKSGGVVTKYSVFYDNTVSLFRIQFFNSANVSQGTVTFDETKSLDALKTDLTSLSITGLVFDVVDDDGVSVTSTLKAYLLETVIETEVLNSDDTFNSAFGWVLVQTATSDDVLFDYVASGDWRSNSNFAGISPVNLNNAIYITDGGFPIKYDGFAAYRAGMPKILATTFSGLNVAVSATAGNYPDGSYGLKYQLRYKDPSGSIVFGKVQDSSEINLKDYSYLVGMPASPNQKRMDVTIKRIAQDDSFPIWACKISGNQTLSGSGPYVVNVDTGHTVKVGQALRINELTDGYTSAVIYAEVTATTATTITLAALPYSLSGLDLVDDQVINSCYVPNNVLGTLDTKVGYGNFGEAIDIYGPYYVLLSTKATAAEVGPFYEITYFDVPQSAAQEYTRSIDAANNNLYIAAFDPTQEAGEDLPRACRYLSKWQQQMLQSGRPYDAQTLIDGYYPTAYDPAAAIAGSDYNLKLIQALTNTEALLCDLQSIFWASVEYPEGFSQSGTDQDSVDTEFNDEITGMGANKDAFFAFKERSMALFTGTLATGDIQKEVLETDIGCGSHLSIQEVQGALMWVDRVYGFCMVVAGRLPEPVGFPIQDKQKKNPFLQRSEQFRWAGARAVNHRINDQYLCYIPTGTNDAENVTEVPYPGSGSTVFVFDYAATSSGIRSAWYYWREMNAAGGFLSFKDQLLFASFENAATQTTWSQKLTGTKYDFGDHKSAIAWIMKSAWINFGVQAINKKWVQACLTSVVRGFSVLVSQYYNYVDTKAAEISVTFTPGKTASPKMQVPLNNEQALACSLGFENSALYEDVSINGWDIQFSSEYDPGEVKR